MKNLIGLVFVLILSGCAPTTILLNECKNNVYLDSLKMEDIKTVDHRQSNEVSKEILTLIYPREVKLNKLLLENKLKCSDLEKVEIEVQERFGLFNKIILRF